MTRILTRLLVVPLLTLSVFAQAAEPVREGSVAAAGPKPAPGKPPLVVPWTPPALGEAPAVGKTSSAIRLLPLPRRYDGKRPKPGFVPPTAGTAVSLGGRKPPPTPAPTCLAGMKGTFPDCYR